VRVQDSPDVEAGTLVFTSVAPPDLSLAKLANGSFEQRGSASYTLTVTNAGAGATFEPYTVTDPLPAGLAAGIVTSPDPGWDCSASTATTVNCTRNEPLAAGASTLLQVPVAIAADAPASIANTATVQTGGDANTGNNSATAVVAVSPYVCPAITVTNPATASGIVNQPYSQVFAAQGGTGPYTFALESGTPPPGLALAGGGSLSGTPTATGSFPLVVRATDTKACVGVGPAYPLEIVCPTTVVTTGNDSGPGSLRQIIADACEGSTITFASGVSVIDLSSAELAITKALTINGGAGVTLQRVAGSPAFRHFTVDANLTLERIELLGGSGASGAGSIASVDGGSIYLVGGSLTLLGSRVLGNSSAGFGGAIFVSNGATLNVVNSLIAGNRAGATGGGIRNRGSLLVVNSTIAGNFAGTGGGIANAGTFTAALRNTLVYGNEAGTSPEIDNSTGLVSQSSLVGVDPFFVSLLDASDNAPTAGGDYRLGEFSVAVDAGENALVPGGVGSDLGDSRASSTMPESSTPAAARRRWSTSVPTSARSPPCRRW
jgi:hypothetical protein